MQAEMTRSLRQYARSDRAAEKTTGVGEAGVSRLDSAFDSGSIGECPAVAVAIEGYPVRCQQFGFRMRLPKREAGESDNSDQESEDSGAEVALREARAPSAAGAEPGFNNSNMALAEWDKGSRRR